MEHRFDLWLLLAALAVFSASLATLSAIGPVLGPSLFLRQLVWGLAGGFLIWALSRVHLKALQRIAPAAYMLSIGALLAVLLMGEVRAGTRGWFAVGPITLQPSEFARLGNTLMVAAWLGRRRDPNLSFREAVTLTAIVAAPTALVLMQPDLGVAISYLPLLVAAYWIGGLGRRAWLSLALVGVTAIGMTWQFGLKPYQKERIVTLVNPERDPYGAGYQVRQSKIAVGSGGVSGLGLGRGPQSTLRFLPAQHTDFVFAVWAEATGFLGGSLVLMAYGLMVFRLATVAAAARDRHGLALVTLIGASFAAQIVVNTGMVMGGLPTTGITLPLFSYGGSSLLTSCAALGMAQAVWRHRLVNR
jgi:rod shape determining protein RodA